jgi:hypothetical protein
VGGYELVGFLSGFDEAGFYAPKVEQGSFFPLQQREPFAASKKTLFLF